MFITSSDVDHSTVLMEPSCNGFGELINVLQLDSAEERAEELLGQMAEDEEGPTVSTVLGKILLKLLFHHSVTWIQVAVVAGRHIITG